MLNHKRAPLILDNLVQVLEDLIDDDSLIIYIVHIFKHSLNDQGTCLMARQLGPLPTEGMVHTKGTECQT